jgi:uncharacterized membrane protein
VAMELEKVTKNASRGAKTAVERVGAGKGMRGPAGIAVTGAALAALPFAAEKLAKVAGPKVREKGGEVAEKAQSQLKDTAKEAMPDSPSQLIGGNPLKKLFGGGAGGSEGDDEQSGRAAPGFGSGRRMPVQQAIDVAVPITEAYNAWTQFENWPEFMHRIDSAEQVDDATVSFQAKIWGINKRFEADIVEQKPDERIEWNVTEGYAHSGVVTFHALSKNLTRIDLSVDVDPSNIIDKASRGMRFVKRAVRGDLHRFKAYVELADEEPDGWRGKIEDGRVKRSRPRSSKSRNGSRSSNGSKAKASSKS